MTRFQRSWALAKSSWSVLRSEKHLAWYPVLSAIASIVVFGVVSGLVWVTLGKDTNFDGTETYQANLATWVIVAVGYVGVAFVQTYFLAALCGGANEVLQGRDTTLGRGIAIANTRLHRILPWAVVTATVSVILEAIEERLGFLGQIIAGILGAAWNVLTFLTVPVIVFEDVGPVNALKRSGSLLRQTWGENVIAQVGLGLIGVVAMLPGVVVILLAAVTGVGVIQALGLGIGVVMFVVAIAIVAALSGIYRTALYRYAVDGQVPVSFAGVDLEHAFGARKSGGARFGLG